MTDREDNARLKQIRARDATIASQAVEIAALKAHIERGREMANLIRRAPDAVTHV